MFRYLLECTLHHALFGFIMQLYGCWNPSPLSRCTHFFHVNVIILATLLFLLPTFLRGISEISFNHFTVVGVCLRLRFWSRQPPSPPECRISALAPRHPGNLITCALSPAARLTSPPRPAQIHLTPTIT